MAANIIYPDAQWWALYKEFLEEVGDGAIIVSPEAQEQLKERGWRPETARHFAVDYPIWDEPHCMIDVVDSVEGDFTFNHLVELHGLEDDDE
jgi:hypothetical protein